MPRSYGKAVNVSACASKRDYWTYVHAWPFSPRVFTYSIGGGFRRISFCAEMILRTRIKLRQNELNDLQDGCSSLGGPQGGNRIRQTLLMQKPAACIARRDVTQAHQARWYDARCAEGEVVRERAVVVELLNRFNELFQVANVPLPMRFQLLSREQHADGRDVGHVGSTRNGCQCFGRRSFAFCA